MLGDEGSGAVLGRNLVNGIFEGAHSAERGVSRGARAELRGDHPPRLPRALRQPLSGLVRTFHTHAYRPPGDPGAGTPVVPRLCVRNLSRYPAELPVSLLGGVAAHFEALLREALEAEGRRVENHRRIARRRAFEIPLWKIESPNRIRPDDDLQRMSVHDILTGINREDARVHEAVRRTIPVMELLVERIVGACSARPDVLHRRRDERPAGGHRRLGAAPDLRRAVPTG